MPLYEYYCRRCGEKFEALRPVSRMNDPATCPQGHQGAERVLSAFTALSRGADGTTAPVSGGCAGCVAGTCTTCGVR